MCFYFFFSHCRINVSYNNNGHQIRSVPVTIESFYDIILAWIDDTHFSNRQPFGISWIFKNDRNVLFHHPVLSAKAQAPFFVYYSSFFVNFFIVEAEFMRPVLKNHKSRINQALPVRRHLKHINCFIKTGVSIQVGPKIQSWFFEEVD